MKLAKKYCPGLVIPDLNLPGMDGKSIFQELRGHKVTAKIPVIAPSENAMEDDIQEILGLGFKSNITKPINVNNFLEKIDRMLV
ncbi:MAG: response regulator [Nitrospinota bacterium]|nr:response regulator [Nitrospinota bacterium]